MKGVGRRILALGLAPMVILGSGLSGTAASAAAAQEKTVKTDMVRPAAEGSYAAYRQLYIDRAAPKGEAILDMSKARPNDAADTDLSQDGKELTVLGEGGEVSWEFEVQEEGLYCLEFTYRTEESLHSKISFSLLLDGAAPVSYTHLDVYKRQRTWRRISCRISCGIMWKDCKIFLALSL